VDVEVGFGTAHLEEMLSGVGLLSGWRWRGVVVWLVKGAARLMEDNMSCFFRGGGQGLKYRCCPGFYLWGIERPSVTTRKEEWTMGTEEVNSQTRKEGSSVIIPQLTSLSRCYSAHSKWETRRSIYSAKPKVGNKKEYLFCKTQRSQVRQQLPMRRLHNCPSYL
jgi:hypothetical protein